MAIAVSLFTLCPSICILWHHTVYGSLRQVRPTAQATCLSVSPRRPLLMQIYAPEVIDHTDMHASFFLRFSLSLSSSSSFVSSLLRLPQIPFLSIVSLTALPPLLQQQLSHTFDGLRQANSCAFLPFHESLNISIPSLSHRLCRCKHGHRYEGKYRKTCPSRCCDRNKLSRPDEQRCPCSCLTG